MIFNYFCNFMVEKLYIEILFSSMKTLTNLPRAISEYLFRLTKLFSITKTTFVLVATREAKEVNMCPKYIMILKPS
jgi:hypothetical protein